MPAAVSAAAWWKLPEHLAPVAGASEGGKGHVRHAVAMEMVAYCTVCCAGASWVLVASVVLLKAPSTSTRPLVVGRAAGSAQGVSTNVTPRMWGIALGAVGIAATLRRASSRARRCGRDSGWPGQLCRLGLARN